MSAMSNLMVDLMEELRDGFLSFEDIAAKYEVPVSWVSEAAEQLLSEMIAEATLE